MCVCVGGGCLRVCVCVNVCVRWVDDAFLCVGLMVLLVQTLNVWLVRQVADHAETNAWAANVLCMRHKLQPRVSRLCVPASPFSCRRTFAYTRRHVFTHADTSLHAHLHSLPA